VTYQAYTYPQDGCGDQAVVIETGSLEHCREAVKKELGDLDEWRLWNGLSEDGDVEAYHESEAEGCGGIAIRKL
jgi:hypothetical protein